MKSLRATEHSIPLRAAGADDASAINYLRFQESGHTWIYNLQKYIRHEEVKKQNHWHNWIPVTSRKEKKERMPRKIIPVIRLDERGQQSAPANYLEYAKMNRPSDKIYQGQRLSWTLESFPVTSWEERKRPWEIHLTLISSISRRTSVLSNFDPEHSPSSIIHPRL